MIGQSKELIQRLWGSPTVTSWFSFGAQGLRLFILLPLVLRTFNEVEVASWLLFGTLLFFGGLVFDQVSVLFSRMIALSMGGANDLSPITGKVPRSEVGATNWNLVQRVYAVTGSLNLILVGVCLLPAIGLGVFAFGSLLDGYDQKQEIWWAFGILLLGDGFVQVFRRYSIALRGMNYVALTNRWNALFNVLSAAIGALALLLNAGIIQLAVVIQLVAVLGLFRFWFVLHYVAEPRFQAFAGYGWDRQVLAWAWPPFWRAFVQGVASKGSLKISTIIFARHGDPSIVASFLIAVRVLEAINQISQAPITSHVPRFSRLLAEGRIETLRTAFQRQMKLAQWLLISGSLAAGAILPYGLSLIGSKTVFLPFNLFVFFAFAYILSVTIRHTLMISVIGNNIVSIKSYITSLVVSVPLAIFLIPDFGILGVIVAAFIPQIVIVNWGPLICGARLLNTSPISYFNKVIMPAWAFGLIFGIVFSSSSTLLRKLIL